MQSVHMKTNIQYEHTFNYVDLRNNLIPLLFIYLNVYFPEISLHMLFQRVWIVDSWKF